MKNRTFTVALSALLLLTFAACKSSGNGNPSGPGGLGGPGGPGGYGGAGGSGSGSSAGGGGFGGGCVDTGCADAITNGGVPCSSTAFDDLSACASTNCASDCAGDFTGQPLSGACGDCLSTDCSGEIDSCNNDI